MLDVIGRRQQSLLSLLLERKEGLTIDRMAEALGITRTAVREHVGALEKDRLVEARTLASTGGRPSRLYTLTERGHALFPKHYGLLARMLVESLSQHLGKEGAKDELRALGEKLAGTLKAKVGGATLKEKAASIAAVMKELGYAASPAAAGGPAIEALNCVFHDLAQADQSICSFDLSLIGALADADVEHRACMARGDNACVFCLKSSKR